MDYNCRCWQEPAISPESAEKEYDGPIDDNYFENVRPGTEPGVWGKPGSIAERMVIDIDDPALKQKVESMIDELDKVLKIDPKRIKKALSVTTREDLLNNAAGVFSVKSTAIMIHPKAPFPEATYVHEYMHYLDTNLFRDKKARNALLDIIKKTSPYKNIEIGLAKGGLTKKKRISLKKLQRDEELLARAFEQYIIGKNSNKLIKDAMNARKLRNEFGYWLDEKEIKKINVFLEALLIKEGLLK